MKRQPKNEARRRIESVFSIFLGISTLCRLEHGNNFKRHSANGRGNGENASIRSTSRSRQLIALIE